LYTRELRTCSRRRKRTAFYFNISRPDTITITRNVCVGDRSRAYMRPKLKLFEPALRVSTLRSRRVRTHRSFVYCRPGRTYVIGRYEQTNTSLRMRRANAINQLFLNSRSGKGLQNEACKRDVVFSMATQSARALPGRAAGPAAASAKNADCPRRALLRATNKQSESVTLVTSRST